VEQIKITWKTKSLLRVTYYDYKKKMQNISVHAIYHKYKRKEQKILESVEKNHDYKKWTKIIAWHQPRWHVMHVKYIHDLCTLSLDIPPYLHHILVIFILFDDY
jgi:hypothetical protein